MSRNLFRGSILLTCLLGQLNAEINGLLRICAIRVDFIEANITSSTSGSGKFLYENQGIDCGKYTIDPLPHDRDYFHSQLVSVHSYFNSVSYGKFGIDLQNSTIYPSHQDSAISLNREMSYYNPYEEQDLQELRLTELFKDALILANQREQINYENYDLVVVFHAGIGQDFSLPFLDPTPEDLPSTYVDSQMIQKHLGVPSIILNGHSIEKGLILPETQNHLLFEISKSMFGDASDPCDYQYGLTGTFALLLGYAVGLPPLWNIESGESRIGIFGLMDQGSNNGRGVVPSPPDAWSRVFAGWETPTEVQYGDVVRLPARGEGNIIKVNIRHNEYFLIENRNNTVKNGMSIDSIRYMMYQNSSVISAPSYMNVLQDSAGIVKDTNGVITSLPNYDIGLPASGLLIWHIDEEVIDSYGGNFGFNNNIQLMGVDLEEADGAQDIGFSSIFLFNDPSVGYFGDMWFQGNSQYYLPNTIMTDQKPEFGPNTYPNTSANDGSSTFIKISDIGGSPDTMSFNVSHTFGGVEYPDSNFNFILQYDLDRDGFNDLLAGRDTIGFYFINGDDLDNIFFHEVTQHDISFLFTELDNYTLINVIEHSLDSTLHTTYRFTLGEGNIVVESQEWRDSLFYAVAGIDDTSLVWKNQFEWDAHTSRLFTDDYSYGIDIGHNGILIDRFTSPLRAWESKAFQYIAGVDANLNSIVDVIALDTNGVLYLFNQDLILLSGFPLDLQLKPPVLAQNLIGSEHPEIVAMSADNSILHIIKYDGHSQYEITNHRGQLLSLGEYESKNAIYTSTNIYQFDEHSSNGGNAWKTYNGDFGNTRTVSTEYSYENKNMGMITRSYCYPNPIKQKTGTIRIETSSAKLSSARVFDLAGYFVAKFEKIHGYDGEQISEWLWDVSSLESGVYFINVSVSDDNKTESDLLKVAVIK